MRDRSQRNRHHRPTRLWGSTPLSMCMPDQLTGTPWPCAAAGRVSWPSSRCRHTTQSPGLAAYPNRTRGRIRGLGQETRCPNGISLRLRALMTTNHMVLLHLGRRTEKNPRTRSTKTPLLLSSFFLFDSPISSHATDASMYTMPGRKHPPPHRELETPGTNQPRLARPPARPPVPINQFNQSIDRSSRKEPVRCCCCLRRRCRASRRSPAESSHRGQGSCQVCSRDREAWRKGLSAKSEDLGMRSWVIECV